MRPTFLLLVGGLVLPLTATTALADQGAVPSYVASGFLAPPRNAPDSARVQGLLAKADEATAAGRMGEARRLYRGLIREQRDAEQYAGTALWRLASNHVFDRDAHGAAMLLDDLASEAARYGDPTMELRASFEAAVLYQQVKRPDVALRNLERVRFLLQSPVIDPETKRGIERRIVQ